MGCGVAGVGRRQRGRPVRVTAVGIAGEIVDFLSHFVDDLGDLFHQFVEVVCAAMDVAVASAVREIDQLVKVVGELVQLLDIVAEMEDRYVRIMGKVIDVRCLFLDAGAVGKEVPIQGGLGEMRANSRFSSPVRSLSS